MEDTIMNIIDWFDPDNIEHLQAYKHLMDTGFWPVGFLPEDVELRPAWSLTLFRILANKYMEEKLSEEHKVTT